MCNGFCYDLKRWFKAFTVIEILLCIAEVIFLTILVGFLVFLILHFIVCSKYTPLTQNPPTISPPFTEVSTSGATTSTVTSADIKSDEGATYSTRTTFPPNLECTWEPSKQTNATAHYYLRGGVRELDDTTMDQESVLPTTKLPELLSELEPSHDYDDVEFLEHSDGETAEPVYNSFVLALVKTRPPADVTFGCILTKISHFWTLTAASCIEAIEEVDSLDSFFMLEGYGEVRPGLSYAVSDVHIHPLYQGANRTYDLAALRSDHNLGHQEYLLRMPTILDYFLIALGERFLILGYGRYRSVEPPGARRRLRQAEVYVTSAAQCADSWAPRHLAGGAAVRGAACGAAPLCAGARFQRGTPCNYCAGAPLLRAGRLYGIMSDNDQCGVACEPTLYVNVAVMRDWIDSVAID